MIHLECRNPLLFPLTLLFLHNCKLHLTLKINQNFQEKIQKKSNSGNNNNNVGDEVNLLVINNNPKNEEISKIKK